MNIYLKPEKIVNIFDKKFLKIREQRFANAPSHPILPEVENRLLQKLALFERQWSVGLTHGMNHPVARYTVTMGHDNGRVIADEEFLPFKNNVFDCIISCLRWHTANDLLGVLIQSLYSLRSKGVFLTALVGENSLWQLKKVFFEVESDLMCVNANHFYPTISANGLLQLLQRAKFALPTVDCDRIDIIYPSFMSMLKSLQSPIFSNVMYERYKQPLSKRLLYNCQQLYEKCFTDYRLSFDILYGSGLKQ